MLYRLFGIVVLVMSIMAILDVARGSKSVLNKVLWIVLILFAPFLGAVLYYLLGRE